jgi:hypothetical protein
MDGINWKKISMIAAFVGATLGIMVSWEKLEFLPRWAWHGEVVAVEKLVIQKVSNVEQFAQGTRRIVLNQEWFRLTADIKQLQAELNENPRNRELIEKLTKMEQQLRDVNSQLDALKGSSL